MAAGGESSKLRNAMKFSWQLLMPGMPSRAHDRVFKYYRTLFDLASIIWEDSGFLNIGYAEDPENADFLDATKALVRRTTRDLLPQGRWLDVGCGTGGPACLMARDHEELHVTGIDITEHQIQSARDRAGRRGLDGKVAFEFGDAMDMPFEDDVFDGVYAVETAFHYPAKDAFVREAFRVLAPGGGFAVADIVWKHKRLPLIHGPRTWFWRNVIASPQIFTAGQWRQSFVGAGFSNIHVEDISRQTIGMYPMWLDQIEKHREELEEQYPARLITLAKAAVVQMVKYAPARYILVTGEKTSFPPSSRQEMGVYIQATPPTQGRARG